MKRSIERFLVYPLSNLIATGQVAMGDLLMVDFSPEIGKLVFTKQAGGALVPGDYEHYGAHEHNRLSSSNAIAIHPEFGPAPARARE